MTGALGIASGGHALIAGLATLGVLLLVLASWRGWWPLWVAAYSVLVGALVVAYFFRDPARTVPDDPAAFVAPADGRVLAVEPDTEPEYLEGPATRVSIFLSLLDVHVQRSPVTGVVEYVSHHPGRFAAAWSEEALRENESTMIGIDAGGTRVVVRQVAGAVARRIVTYPESGQRVARGDRIGLIRFGSRVDLYLPVDARVAVQPGDRVVAGTTVIARHRTPTRKATP